MPGMSNTMAGDMIQGMYGGGGGGGASFSPAPGGGQFGGNIQPPGRPGPWNGWGMGDPPPEMTPAMFSLQTRCLAGDGRACNQLQVAQARQQQLIMEFHRNAGQRGQYHEAARRGSPMGARHG
jgi:hypothetical protein